MCVCVCGMGGHLGCSQSVGDWIEQQEVLSSSQSADKTWTEVGKGLKVLLSKVPYPQPPTWGPAMTWQLMSGCKLPSPICVTSMAPKGIK